MVIPLFEVRYSRVTHPFAALLGAEAPFSRDLHVLGTPPAFVLSQDQTLQFDLDPAAPAFIKGRRDRASCAFFGLGDDLFDDDLRRAKLTGRSLPDRTNPRFVLPSCRDRLPGICLPDFLRIATVNPPSSTRRLSPP